MNIHFIVILNLVIVILSLVIVILNLAIVILNLFQDNAQLSPVILKQVQDDEMGRGTIRVAQGGGASTALSPS